MLFLILWMVPFFALFSQTKAEIFYLTGKAKLESGQNDSALYYIDKSLELNFNNPDAFLNKGLALYRLSQYKMAIQQFDKVEKASKGEASIWIARCYAELGDASHCVEALQAHLTSNYRLPESTLLLDPALSKLENDPQYIDFWKNGSWYTGFDQTLAEAGYLTKLKKYPEALDVLSDGLGKGYRKAPIYAKRAEIYMLSGNEKLALEELTKAIEFDRKNPELFTKRAELLYMAGKYKAALEDYNAAIKLDPEELRYTIGRARALSKTGNYDEAVNDMKNYLQYYPGSDSAWYYFGMINYENGNYFDALNCFSTSLKINQKDARYFAARGATYLKTRTYQYAWKDLSMALDLNPNDSESYLNKGIAAQNTGNMDDACFCFEMAKRMGNKEAFNYAEKYCK